MKKVLIGCLIGLSACTSGFSAGDGMVLAGSPEAIRAYHDGLNGIITNTKTQDPLGDSASWQHRRAQEIEKTKREVPQSFWGKLTAPSRTQSGS
jgi:hypothetical protein